MLESQVRTSGRTRALYCASNSSSRYWSSSSVPLPPVDDGAGQPSLLQGRGGIHDVGGLETLMGQTVDLSNPALQDWEQESHALLIALVKEGYLTTDELRRNIEAMQHDHYVTRSYYCKWATSMALGLIERGVISYTELDEALLGEKEDPITNTSAKAVPKFSVGQRVRVKAEESMARWRKPHLRTPGYIFGVSGVVESYEGNFPDPSYKAFRSLLVSQATNGASPGQERKEHLYRVRFSQKDVWPEGQNLDKKENSKEIDTSDSVIVEIYENWLTDNSHGQDFSLWEMDPSSITQYSHSPTETHYHHDHHGHHGHSHDHEHLPRSQLEERAIELETSSLLCSSGSVQSNAEPTVVVGDRLSSALISLLSQPKRLGQGLRGELRSIINAMESIRVRADGVSLVVRAWTDPSFEEHLLQDASSAALELGINTVNATAPTKLKVVKSELPTPSQPGVHNLITCTLCSCYPLSLLGLSPKWYKSRSYRARAVREPRAMLRDSFRLDLPADEWIIRVHDSTADLRYLVLPPRPPNTMDFRDNELRELVTRDTMIGVALPKGIISS